MSGNAVIASQLTDSRFSSVAAAGGPPDVLSLARNASVSDLALHLLAHPGDRDALEIEMISASRTGDVSRLEAALGSISTQRPWLDGETGPLDGSAAAPLGVVAEGSSRVEKNEVVRLSDTLSLPSENAGRRIGTGSGDDARSPTIREYVSLSSGNASSQMDSDGTIVITGKRAPTVAAGYDLTVFGDTSKAFGRSSSGAQGSTPSIIPPTDQSGGLYADFGIGLGVGFNLHVDREGITGSVGLGLFGRASVAQTYSHDGLVSARSENKIFAELSAGAPFVGEVGVGGDVSYLKNEISLKGSVGVVGTKGTYNFKDKSVQLTEGSISKSGFGGSVGANDVKLGFDGGLGWLYQGNTRAWR